jgi:hypothetical protein
MSSKRILLIVTAIAGALVLVAGGAGFWIVQQSQSSEALTADAALNTFSEEDDGTRDVAGAPAPGVYVYDAVGKETGGGGPLSATRDLPLEAQMIVWQRPGGYTARVVYSGDHLEEADYVIGDEGTAQTRTRTRLSILGTTSDDETPVEPAALWIPTELKVGDAWDAAYESQGYSTSHSSTVTGTEKVDVGGAPVQTFVIERTTTYTGDLTGAWTDTYWWSTDLSLPVKHSVTGESKEGIGTFSQDSTITLRAAEPLTP